MDCSSFEFLEPFNVRMKKRYIYILQQIAQIKWFFWSCSTKYVVRQMQVRTKDCDSERLIVSNSEEVAFRSNAAEVWFEGYTIELI